MSFYMEKEKKFCEFLKKWTPIGMRFSMGFIFLWFGILKVLGISPIEELVRKTAFLVDEHQFVVFLGFWEALMGIFFFTKRFLRMALLLFFVQIFGTFLPLFTNPEDCFTIFPYGLTLEGQYIFKNFILISGAFYVFSTLHEQ